MKIFLKILKWSAIGVTLVLILLFAVSQFLQSDIVALFVSAINKNISTKIEVGSGSFSLISKFPKATVKLDNVFVHPSPDYDHSQFKNINTDTLLFAKSVLLEFKMSDLVKGIYNIESVNVEKGVMNLLSDSAGRVNYEVYKGKSTGAGKDFAVSLDKIIVSNLNTVYINTSTKINIKSLIKSGRFKSKISGNNVDLVASSAMQVSHLDVFPISLKTTTSASVDINLHKSDSGFFFRKGTLRIESFNLGISGLIGSDKNLDLKISGRNIDVSKIKKYLPEKYQSAFIEYDPSGIFRIDCRLKGLADRRNNPEILIYFALDKGDAWYKKSDLKISRLSFYGNFRNGKLRKPESSSLDISKAVATLGLREYSGSLKVENFTSPKIELNFSGEIFPAELFAFFKLKDAPWSEGSVSMDLRLTGRLPLKEKYSLSDVMRLNPDADLEFNSLGIGLNNNKVILKDINGNIKVSRHLNASGLTFSFRDQKFKIDGEFTNLPAWLAGESVYIRAVADVSVGNLRPAYFLPDSTTVPGKRTGFKLPEGVDLDINLNISNLEYRKFTAGDIKGKLLYKPGLLSFRSFNLSSLDGFISGDCFLARSKGKSFVARGNLDLTRIDINKAFGSCNNFLQDFIKAENLSGSLSGKVSLLLPLDSMLYPDFSTSTAEGKVTITDGALINFEPVKSLSRFIELSELEKISFSKFENDFYIKNNYIAFPQMDIRSSAADFTISGKHDFNNNYEYHVKTYLSQLLSRKVKKRPRSTEFGAIEDDGLGRTSVFLKITGKGDDVKVGYDLKASRNNTSRNLKTERDNLKGILSKEYGWYSKDSTVKQETAPKPRFRIQWEESDSISAPVDTSSVIKERGINTIFKRKKGANLK
jgi:hypothetical protein